ncbi:MAG TPA: NUDIX hydrolase [Acidimicrobiales bacterium]
MSFRRLDETEVFRTDLITVAKGTFEAPDGTRFERDVVHHPGAVSMVPVIDTETVIMVRQYRAPVDRWLLEIPAGKRDVHGEPPEETAQRELIEEIGMRPGRLQLLAEFFNSPGFCDEHSFSYLALDLEKAEPSAHGIEEAHMTVHHIALDEVPALIGTGEIVDAKTIIGLMLAREAVRRTP